jgi:hypothetical protein
MIKKIAAIEINLGVEDTDLYYKKTPLAIILRTTNT